MSHHEKRCVLYSVRMLGRAVEGTQKGQGHRADKNNPGLKRCGTSCHFSPMLPLPRKIAVHSLPPLSQLLQGQDMKYEYINAAQPLRMLNTCTPALEDLTTLRDIHVYKVQLPQNHSVRWAGPRYRASRPQNHVFCDQSRREKPHVQPGSTEQHPKRGSSSPTTTSGQASEGRDNLKTNEVAQITRHYSCLENAHAKSTHDTRLPAFLPAWLTLVPRKM